MQWEPVTTGRSGASVSRAEGLYRKEDRDSAVDLRIEGARTTWLGEQGIPVPQVVACDANVLITTEVPGRTAAEAWPEAARPRVVRALAGLARDLHALAFEECPFDRRLARVVPEALAAEVDLDDLDEERLGWDRQRLVDALLEQRPADEDLVVCHGDLCLPNVVLDPVTHQVVALLDTGRLGVADRWADLAIATRSLAGGQNPQYGAWASELFLTSYGVVADPATVAFYRLLDEFF